MTYSLSTLHTAPLAAAMVALPEKFMGCTWDDGWEYDAPCVIYFPWRYRADCAGGNSGYLASLVEDICFDLINGDETHVKRKTDSVDKERAWRGWGRRFDRRKKAEHVVFKVRWTVEDGKPVDYEIVSSESFYGPPRDGVRLDQYGRPVR